MTDAGGLGVPEELLHAAARSVGSRSVRVVANLATSGRAGVARLELVGGPVATAVLKWGGDHVAATRCGLEFVEAIIPGLCPRLLGVDSEHRFTVQEDLGDGPSLVGVLSGDDPAIAEAALIAHAAALGRLAAASRDRYAQWAALVRRLDAPAELLQPSPSDVELRQSWAALRAQLPEIQLEGQAADDLEVMAGRLADRQLHTFSIGDCCPDNNRWDGTAIRLFDTDFCSFRHPLLDGAYHWAPFPTCWFVGQIPAAVSERVQAAYRRSMEVDEGEMALVCCAWTVLNLGWLLERTIAADRELGPVTYRRMLRWRVETTARRTREVGVLPGLSTALARLAELLADRWPGSGQPEVYPTFRGRTPCQSGEPA